MSAQIRDCAHTLSSVISKLCKFPKCVEYMYFIHVPGLHLEKLSRREGEEGEEGEEGGGQCTEFGGTLPSEIFSLLDPLHFWCIFI